LAATLIIATLTIAIPYTPLGTLFGFVKLPALFILLMLVIVVIYIFAAELVKKVFYKYSKL
jgi:Mg2+-importing ATPase